MEVAPDLESWAITKNFEINTQELIDALQHYQTALTLWQHSNNLELQAKILGEMALCAYLQAMKQQDNQHRFWQKTQQYISDYIQLITQINRPDIIANSLVKAGNILRELTSCSCGMKQPWPPWRG